MTPTLSSSLPWGKILQPHFRPVDEEMDSRTISSIVYSCLSTLILVTLYCIRPNISSRDAPVSERLWKKMNIIIWMFLSPELIMCWAFYQWYEGNQFVKQYKNRGWTAAHGQLAIMGGLLLYKEGKPSQILSPEEFTRLLDAGSISFPQITQRDIQLLDRSHPVLAGITLLQVLWFLIQCISRLAQKLVITQLEVATLAIVVMNGLLLALWWNKPLDACSSFRVDLIQQKPALLLPGGADEEDVVKWDFARENHVRKGLKSLLRFDSHRVSQKAQLRVRLSSFLWNTPMRFIENVYDQYGELLLRIDVDEVKEESMVVPLFYSPDSNQLGPFLFAIMNLLGSMFAAAHLSLWFSDFPTHRDALVWRISGIITAVYPMILLCGLIAMLFAYVLMERWTFANGIEDWLIKVFQYIAIVVIVVGFPVACAARMALIVEAFLSLKSLPPSTLQVLPWTNYIPHLA